MSMALGRGTAPAGSSEVQRKPLDVPALLREVLTGDPDPYKAYTVVLGHARAVTGSSGGAVLRLDAEGGLEVLASQGRASTQALGAFQPGGGRLAPPWTAEGTEPTVSSALLDDAGGPDRVAITYAVLPSVTRPTVVLLLSRTVPAAPPTAESLTPAPVERLLELARVVCPLLDAVHQQARQQRELVETVRRAQDAKAAVRARDAFLARMSHDLRTPLGVILGFAQLLEMEALTGEQRESVEQILKAARRLHRLLTQAIEVAHATAGKLTLMVQPVEVRALLTECVAMAKGEATRADVPIEVVSPPEPLVISTDPQRLSQVVLNLLSNAVKASPKRRPVEVRLSHDEDAVSIAVTDHGPGIQPQLLPRLFIPFAAAEPGDDAESSLGLPLSHSLAAALGGTLMVRSEPGQGSTFTVTLPRR